MPYKISSSFFVQSNRPSNIVIIPVADEEALTITAAITDAINAGLEFYHIVIRSTAESGWNNCIKGCIRNIRFSKLQNRSTLNMAIILKLLI